MGCDGINEVGKHFKWDAYLYIIETKRNLDEPGLSVSFDKGVIVS